MDPVLLGNVLFGEGCVTSGEDGFLGESHALPLSIITGTRVTAVVFPGRRLFLPLVSGFFRCVWGEGVVVPDTQGSLVT